MIDLPGKVVLIIFAIVVLLAGIVIALLMNTNIGTNLAKTLGILTALG